MNTTAKTLLFSVALAFCVIPRTFGQWSLTGNMGTNPLTNFLGTDDGTDLSIRTTNERMRIKYGGPLKIIGCPTCTGPAEDHLQVQNLARDWPDLLILSDDVSQDQTQFDVRSKTGSAAIAARGNGVGIGMVNRFEGNDPGFQVYGLNSRDLFFDEKFDALLPQSTGVTNLGSNSLLWKKLHIQDLRLDKGAQPGYVLSATDNLGNVEWVPGASSQWIYDAGNIYNANLSATPGHVGIGTTSPDQRLHIKVTGNGGVTGSYTSPVIRLEAENVANQVGNPTAFDLELDTKGTFAINDATSGTSISRMLINEKGDVGIGTTNPKRKLHVNGFTYLERADNPTWENTKVNFGISSFHSQDQGLRFEISDDGGSTFSDVLHLKNNATIGIGTTDIEDHIKLLVASDKHTGLAVSTLGNTAMNGVEPINFLAAVGDGDKNAFVVSNIGSPNCLGEYTFRVNGAGRVEATEIEVRSTWCDYVFEEDYELMPLEELDEFLTDNKHLPGIPKASVVESEGLELGSMQRRMMEKIEELTLYTIQQQKELDLLKAQNLSLLKHQK